MSDTIWEEFSIDTADKWDNPVAFATRIAIFCQGLKTDVVSVNSIGGLKNAFISKAEKDLSAKDKASMFIQTILDDMAELDPEVIVHVLAQLKKLDEFGDGIVLGAAMRTTTRTYSRKRAIAMYRRLRDAYNTYCNAMSVLFSEKGYIFPIVPPLTGNYSDNQLMGDNNREFIFAIDGETYLNYHYVARILGVEISSMMDLVDFLEANTADGVGEINGHSVELLEL